MSLTFGSLFAGIGGFDLGLERAGMTCRWQVENDPYAQRVLANHWPDVPRWDDIRSFPPGPSVEDWRVDLLCGGDPCQENSNARKGDYCSQPSLGSEFIRVVDVLRPRLVLRENPSSVRRDAPWPWRRFRSELESLGYAVLPFRLRACCFGADHRRDRLFLLAETAYPSGIRQQRFDWRRTGEIPKDRSLWRTTKPGVGRVAHGVPSRVDRLRCLGNAVVPQVAEWIGRRILEC